MYDPGVIATSTMYDPAKIQQIYDVQIDDRPQNSTYMKRVSRLLSDNNQQYEPSPVPRSRREKRHHTDRKVLSKTVFKTERERLSILLNQVSVPSIDVDTAKTMHRGT